MRSSVKPKTLHSGIRRVVAFAGVALMLFAGSEAAVATMPDESRVVNEAIADPEEVLDRENALDSDTLPQSAVEPSPEPAVEPSPEPAVEPSSEPSEESPVEAEYSQELDDPSDEASDFVEDVPNVAPYAVTSPPSGHTVLNVRVGGDRIGDSYNNVQATGVAGVRMRLSSSATNPNAWSDQYSWNTDCISDQDGDCTFIVPNRGSGNTNNSGMNRDAKPYVHIIEAPEGYFLNSQVRLGDGTGKQRNYPIDYVGQFTQRVTAGNTYQAGKDFFAWRSYPHDFMEDDRVDYNTGIAAISRENPPLPMTCGMDVAFLVDVSSSIDDAGGISAVTGAMDSMVEALVGTPSSIAVFSYGSASPGNNASPDTPTLQSVRTQQQANAVKASYTQWGPSGRTNWDSAFMRAARSGQQYDLVVNLTDGMPTTHATERYNTISDADGWGNLASLEAAIFSANLVKSQGTPILTLAVGQGVEVPATHLNLRATSGEGDYIVHGDYAAAAQYFANFARGNCDGSIEVEKRVISAGVNVPTGATPAQLNAISEPAEGWQISGSTTAPGVAIGNPAGPWMTQDNGIATVPLKFTHPTTTGPVTFTETMQDGFSHQPVVVGGVTQNAVCRDADTGANVTALAAGDASNPGVTVNARTGGAILCTIYNVETPLPPDVCLPGVIYTLTDKGQVRQINLAGDKAEAATVELFDFNLPQRGDGTVASNSLAVDPSTGDMYALNLWWQEAPQGRYNHYLDVHRWDAQTGAVTRENQIFTGTSQEIWWGTVAGAYDPVSNAYYFGILRKDVGQAYIYKVAPGASNLESMLIARFSVPNNIMSSSVAGNGDMAFDHAGNLHVVASSASASALFTIEADVLQNHGTASLMPRTVVNLPNETGLLYNGIALDEQTRIWVQGTSETTTYVVGIDPNTMQPLGPSVTLTGMPIYGVDLASCQTPSRIVLDKVITERADIGDNFGLEISRLDQPDVPLAQGETGSESLTGSTGTALAVAGAQYLLTERAISGSLDNYSTTATCTYGDETVAVTPVQDPVSGTRQYLVTFPTGAQLGKKMECTYTNSAIPDTTFLLEKYGESKEGDMVLTDGSKWAVFTDADLNEKITDIETSVAGQNGRFELVLAPGEYWLVETQAPEGFQLLAEPVRFTVTSSQQIVMAGIDSDSRPVALIPGSEDDPFTIQVFDVPAFDLPVTGGSGEIPFLVSGGLLLLAAAAGFGYLSARRQELPTTA